MSRSPMRTIAELGQLAAVSTGPSALLELGRALIRRGEEAEGVEWFRTAIARAPSAIGPRVRLGLSLFELGDLDDAAAVFESVLSDSPDCAVAAGTLGLIQTARAQIAPAARVLLTRAVRHEPENLLHHTALCRVFVLQNGTELRRWQSTLRAWFGDVYHPLLSPRGMVHALCHFGGYRAARPIARELHRKYPDDLTTLLDCAEIDIALRRYRAAASAHARATTEHPVPAVALLERVKLLFRRGHYDEARQLYLRDEHRSVLQESGVVPAWADARLDGKTVLLRSLGGYGDTMNFAARFARRLHDAGASVTIECTAPIRDALSSVPGVRTRLPHDAPEAFDFEADTWPPAMLFEWDWPIASDVPYVFARTHAAVPVVGPEGDRVLRIGIAWRNSSLRARNLANLHDPYTARSIPRVCLEPLLRTPGTRWYSLQVDPEPPADLAATPVTPLLPRTATFADTASALEQLDLVVSVDTSVAHLAGAMGRPCLLLLPYLPCWRWLTDATESGWYPSLRIFRQSAPGEWAPVVAAVREEVANRAQRTAGAWGGKLCRTYEQLPAGG